MATDDFKGSNNRTDPITAAVAVDLSTADQALTHVSRYVYVGTAGDLKVDLASGSTITFKSLANGWHPIRATKVYKTGTTATDVVAAW